MIKNKANPSSGTLSIRFDPKLRYSIELAARVLHRSLSGLIEAAIRDYLEFIFLTKPGDDTVDKDDLSAIIEDLWDVDHSYRFCNLALKYPHLLNYEEQKLWKIILGNPAYWDDKKNLKINLVHDDWCHLLA